MHRVLTISFILTILISYLKCESVNVELRLANLYNLKDFEQTAKSILLSSNKSGAWTYLESGTMDEETIDENTAAFRNIRIRPHYMRNVSVRNLETNLFGTTKINIPIGISPSALHQIWNEVGEIGTVRAAQEIGTFMILSSASSITIEDVSQAGPNVTKWLQVFLPNLDDPLNVEIDLIKRAETAGFKAIVFTIDSPVGGGRQRYSTMRANFTLISDTYPMRNFELYPGWKHVRQNQLSWKDFEWIKKLTKLPIVLKGILTAEDAREAVKAGVNAVIVSNHGGRQLDGVPATIEALSEIVKEVRGVIDVYLDGGIRSGKDVFKAIALGAKAVLIGRPVAWGLTVAGEAGVTKVLNILKNELDDIMGLAGCPTLSDIQRDNVAHKLEYFRKMMDIEL